MAVAFLLVIRLHGWMQHSPAEIARTVFELLLVLRVFRPADSAGVVRSNAWMVGEADCDSAAGFVLHRAAGDADDRTAALDCGARRGGGGGAGASERGGRGAAGGRRGRGYSEESDRELVRTAVEFGDKLVREVMTPRPEIFAVPETMTLEAFLAR